MHPTYATQWAAHYAAEAARGNASKGDSGPTYKQQVERIRGELVAEMLGTLNAGGEAAATMRATAALSSDKVRLVHSPSSLIVAVCFIQELEALQSELETLSKVNIGQKQQQKLKQLEQQQERHMADYQQSQQEAVTSFTLTQDKERKAHQATRLNTLSKLQEEQQEAQQAIEKQVDRYSTVEPRTRLN
jgi:hypothetical protein